MSAPASARGMRALRGSRAVRLASDASSWLRRIGRRAWWARSARHPEASARIHEARSEAERLREHAFAEVALRTRPPL